MRLTVKATEGIKLPKGKTDYIEFDDDIPGFGIRLREGGSRTWIFQYRIGKKQRRMELGSANAAELNLAEVRKTASKLHGRVALGQDPAMDKATARLEVDNTFGLLADQFLKARKASWRPRTYEEIRRHQKSMRAPCTPFRSPPLRSGTLPTCSAIWPRKRAT